MQNFELISFANADELAARAASAWLDEIAAANHAARPHCVALSGGRIALKFFAVNRQAGQSPRTFSSRTSIFFGRTSAAFRQPTRKAISKQRTNFCSRR